MKICKMKKSGRLKNFSGRLNARRAESKNVARRVKGGYVLIETRPRWDGNPGPWTECSVAKIIFHNPSRKWRLYWMRASGKWWFYGEYKTFGKTLEIIKEDSRGCFWG
jgi:Protein of unknown function (DUF3024).